MKNAAGVKHGDVVRLKGDPSLWLVMDVYDHGRSGRRFSVVVPRSNSSRIVKPHEVDKHWRLAGRPRTGGTTS